jgi:hypothetical protein
MQVEEVVDSIVAVLLLVQDHQEAVINTTEYLEDIYFGAF